MGMMLQPFGMRAFDSIPEMWRFYVPSYESRVYRPFFVRVPFAGLPSLARRIRRISERRSRNRILNYLRESDVVRVQTRQRDFSIRFGVKKPGHGYSKTRGDFCLVSGVYDGRTLTLFYRSIELIGGLAFDLVLIEEVCRRVGIIPKSIEIWAVKGFVFALKRNSNEKLYPKLKEIYGKADKTARLPRRIIRRRSQG